ncbi:MAG TPA: polysaccharide deacetylase family protein, partial [Chitinispirillaceae bacterium]|nr:polysaccharide deacetylase family protein [Chitinispirillaceae bacterium]
KNAFNAISLSHILIAIFLTVINYAVMIGYDWFGLRYAGANPKIGRTAASSFIGDSLNANMGFSAAVGSIIKLRYYTRWGIPAGTVLKAIATYTMAYWLGFFFLASTSLIFAPSRLFFFESHLIQTAVGVLLFLPVVFYLYFILFSRAIKLPWGLELAPPAPKTGILLLGTGIFDWLLSALIFYVLIPSASFTQFPVFASLYTWSHLVGMASQVPGGVAVFESAALMLSGINKSSLLGTLLLFRAVFFILPCIFALVSFIILELRHKLSTGNSLKYRTANLQKPVTIVVPAYNEESSLATCIASLKKQDYTGPLEIVIIDNASTDCTAQIAESMGVRVIYEPRKGYNYAVKRGFDEAGSEIIACTDADSVVPSNWISKLVSKFIDDKVVACGGVFCFADGSPWIRALGILGKLNYHIAGANMAVRKSSYHQVGGFSLDVNLGADVDLGQRLRKTGKVVIDRSIVVATSSRRFQMAFWETIFRYYINDISIFIRKKPVFYSFTNYRINTMDKSGGRYAVVSVAALCIFLLSGWLLQNPSSQIMGKVISSGKPVPAVALTFNNGPGVSTDTILKILARYNAHATFFIIGENAEANPELLRKISQAGHEIGNQTYSHKIGSAIQAPSRLNQQIIKTDEVIHSITGQKSILFRPPLGMRNPWMIRECNNIGKSVVLWNVDSRDWLHLSPEIMQHSILNTVGPGSIILFHDRLDTKKDKFMNNTVEALPQVLENLTKRGYTFLTVSELQHAYYTTVARF